MKYEIEFINKLQDGVPRNTILTFGETDVKSIAHYCFENGRSGSYDGLRISKIKTDYTVDATYNNLYEKALRELNLNVNEIDDYRPADPLYIPELKQLILAGIIIWMKNGTKIIYIDSDYDQTYLYR